jgi:hypothetical protein
MDRRPPTDTFLMTLFSGRNNCFYPIDHVSRQYDGVQHQTTSLAMGGNFKKLSFDPRSRDMYLWWNLLEVAIMDSSECFSSIPFGIATRLLTLEGGMVLCTYCNSSRPQLSNPCRTNSTPASLNAQRNMVTAILNLYPGMYRKWSTL